MLVYWVPSKINDWNVSSSRIFFSLLWPFFKYLFCMHVEAKKPAKKDPIVYEFVLCALLFIFSSGSLLKVTLCVTSMVFFWCWYPQKMRESHTNHKEWAQKGHRHIFSIYHALWALTFFKFCVIFLLSLWLSGSYFYHLKRIKKSQSKDDTSSTYYMQPVQKKVVGFFYLNIIYFFVNCCGKGYVYTRWRRRYKEREWII